MPISFSEDHLHLATLPSVAPIGSRRQVRSGNPWFDPKSGKFARGIPGIGIRIGHAIAGALPDHSVRAVKSRQKASGADNAALFRIGPGQVLVRLFRGDEEVDRFNVSSVGSRTPGGIQEGDAGSPNIRLSTGAPQPPKVRFQPQTGGNEEEQKRREDAVKRAAREIGRADLNTTRQWLSGNANRTFNSDELVQFHDDMKKERVLGSQAKDGPLHGEIISDEQIGGGEGAVHHIVKLDNGTDAVLTIGDEQRFYQQRDFQSMAAQKGWRFPSLQYESARRRGFFLLSKRMQSQPDLVPETDTRLTKDGRIAAIAKFLHGAMPGFRARQRIHGSDRDKHTDRIHAAAALDFLTGQQERGGSSYVLHDDKIKLVENGQAFPVQHNPLVAEHIYGSRYDTGARMIQFHHQRGEFPDSVREDLQKMKDEDAIGDMFREAGIDEPEAEALARERLDMMLELNRVPTITEFADRFGIDHSEITDIDKFEERSPQHLRGLRYSTKSDEGYDPNLREQGFSAPEQRLINSARGALRSGSELHSERYFGKQEYTNEELQVLQRAPGDDDKANRIRYFAAREIARRQGMPVPQGTRQPTPFQSPPFHPTRPDPGVGRPPVDTRRKPENDIQIYRGDEHRSGAVDAALEKFGIQEDDIKDMFRSPYLEREGWKTTVKLETSDDNVLAIDVTFEDKDGLEAGTMHRTLYQDADGLHAEHDLFKLLDQHEDQGIGKELLEAHVALYDRMGVVDVNLAANIDVGGYAWARYGWDFRDNVGRRNIMGAILGGIGSPEARDTDFVKVGLDGTRLYGWDALFGKAHKHLDIMLDTEDLTPEDKAAVQDMKKYIEDGTSLLTDPNVRAPDVAAFNADLKLMEPHNDRIREYLKEVMDPNEFEALARGFKTKNYMLGRSWPGTLVLDKAGWQRQHFDEYISKPRPRGRPPLPRTRVEGRSELGLNPHFENRSDQWVARQIQTMQQRLARDPGNRLAQNSLSQLRSEAAARGLSLGNVPSTPPEPAVVDSGIDNAIAALKPLAGTDPAIAGMLEQLKNKRRSRVADSLPDATPTPAVQPQAADVGRAVPTAGAPEPSPAPEAPAVEEEVISDFTRPGSIMHRLVQRGGTSARTRATDVTGVLHTTGGFDQRLAQEFVSALMMGSGGVSALRRRRLTTPGMDRTAQERAQRLEVQVESGLISDIGFNALTNGQRIRIDPKVMTAIGTALRKARAGKALNSTDFSAINVLTHEAQHSLTGDGWDTKDFENDEWRSLEEGMTELISRWRTKRSLEAAGVDLELAGSRDVYDMIGQYSSYAPEVNHLRRTVLEPLMRAIQKREPDLSPKQVEDMAFEELQRIYNKHDHQTRLKNFDKLFERYGMNPASVIAPNRSARRVPRGGFMAAGGRLFPAIPTPTISVLQDFKRRVRDGISVQVAKNGTLDELQDLTLHEISRLGQDHPAHDLYMSGTVGGRLDEHELQELGNWMQYFSLSKIKQKPFEGIRDEVIRSTPNHVLSARLGMSKTAGNMDDVAKTIEDELKARGWDPTIMPEASAYAPTADPDYDAYGFEQLWRSDEALQFAVDFGGLTDDEYDEIQNLIGEHGPQVPAINYEQFVESVKKDFGVDLDDIDAAREYLLGPNGAFLARRIELSRVGFVGDPNSYGWENPKLQKLTRLYQDNMRFLDELSRHPQSSRGAKQIGENLERSERFGSGAATEAGKVTRRVALSEKIEDPEVRDAISINALRRGMSMTEYADAVEAHYKKMLGEDKGAMAIRIRSSLLSKVFQDGKLKNFWETGHGIMTSSVEDLNAHDAHEGLVSKRASIDSELFELPGSPQDDPGRYPIYGFFDDFDGATAALSDLENFGDVDMELDNSLRNRTTFVHTDSIEGAVPSPLDDPSVGSVNWESTELRGMTGSGYEERVDPLLANNVNDLVNGARNAYHELQIHGGVKMEDVKRLTFRDKLPDGEMQLQLMKAGFVELEPGEWAREGVEPRTQALMRARALRKLPALPPPSHIEEGTDSASGITMEFEDPPGGPIRDILRRLGVRWKLKQGET